MSVMTLMVFVSKEPLVFHPSMLNRIHGSYGNSVPVDEDDLSTPLAALVDDCRRNALMFVEKGVAQDKQQ